MGKADGETGEGYRWSRGVDVESDAVIQAAQRLKGRLG